MIAQTTTGTNAAANVMHRRRTSARRTGWTMAASLTFAVFSLLPAAHASAALFFNGYMGGGNCSGASSTGYGNMTYNVMQKLTSGGPNVPLKNQLQLVGGTCQDTASPAGSFRSGLNYIQWGPTSAWPFRYTFCWIPAPYNGTVGCNNNL